MKKALFAITIVFTIIFLFFSLGIAAPTSSPVKIPHINMIKSLFHDNGLKDADVRVDKYGRVELRGSYKDKQEVELAFSLAQAVVGVKWVSPVTPEDIKVKEWEKKLTGLFPTKGAKTVQRKETTEKTIDPTKHALIVGISNFMNHEKYRLRTGKELNLRFAEKDARDVYSYLIDPRLGRFPKENVCLLLNEDATKIKIQDTLDRIKQKSRSTDDVLVYFSSHGTPSRYDGSMNIVTYDSDLQSINTSWQTSLSADYLRDFIVETKAKTMIVVLDVCYSGAAFKNITGFYYSGSKEIEFDNDSQGISRAIMAKSLFGAKDIVFEEDAVRNTEVTRDKNSIRVLMSASDSGEKSWESEVLESSFFTHYFLDGLKKHGGVKEAFTYAKPKVTTGVLREKNAEQHPQVVADQNDWNIRIVKQ